MSGTYVAPTGEEDAHAILDHVGAPRTHRCVDGADRPLGLGGRLRMLLRAWAPLVDPAKERRTHFGTGGDKPRRCGAPAGCGFWSYMASEVDCIDCLRDALQDVRTVASAMATTAEAAELAHPDIAGDPAYSKARADLGKALARIPLVVLGPLLGALLLAGCDTVQVDERTVAHRDVKPSNYLVEADQVTEPGQLEVEAVAACDEGDRLVAGGCAWGDVVDAHDMPLRPLEDAPAEAGWRCRGQNTGVGVELKTLRATALCEAEP